MATKDLKERLTRLERHEAKIGRRIERTKIAIKESERADGTTILVAGIRWARVDLGVDLDNPWGGYYNQLEPIQCPDGWRPPTSAENIQLEARTTREWVRRNGINGTLFTDKENSNEMFISASGFKTSDGMLHSVGEIGFRWSSSMFNADLGYTLYFYSGLVYPQSRDSRSSGFSVRCVKI